jgi:glycosyltransferase involved in cell wall biosynthesis
VVGEALACGTPVIASCGYPWASLETEGFGRRVEMKEGLFAAAVQDVLSWSADRRRRVQERSPQFIQSHFSWSSVGQRYLNLYHEILDGKMVD